MSHHPHSGRRRAGPRGRLRCPVSPLVAMGVILTIAGAALYTTPGERPEIVAAGALVLSAIAAWWCASRQG